MNKDIEETIELFDRSGIEYKVFPVKESTLLVIRARSDKDLGAFKEVFTEFTFDCDGNFIDIGVW